MSKRQNNKSPESAKRARLDEKSEEELPELEEELRAAIALVARPLAEDELWVEHEEAVENPLVQAEPRQPEPRNASLYQLPDFLASIPSMRRAIPTPFIQRNRYWPQRPPNIISIENRRNPPANNDRPRPKSDENISKKISKKVDDLEKRIALIEHRYRTFQANRQRARQRPPFTRSVPSLALSPAVERQPNQWRRSIARVFEDGLIVRGPSDTGSVGIPVRIINLARIAGIREIHFLEMDQDPAPPTQSTRIRIFLFQPASPPRHPTPRAPDIDIYYSRPIQRTPTAAAPDDDLTCRFCGSHDHRSEWCPFREISAAVNEREEYLGRYICSHCPQNYEYWMVVHSHQAVLCPRCGHSNRPCEMVPLVATE